MADFIPVNSLEAKLRALMQDTHTPSWSFYTPLAAAQLWIIIKNHPELDGSELAVPEGENPEVLVFEGELKKETFVGIYTAACRAEEVFNRFGLSRAEYTYVSAPGYQLLGYLIKLDVHYLIMNEGVKEGRYQLDPDMVEILLSRPEPSYEQPKESVLVFEPDEALLRALEPLKEFLGRQPNVRAAWILMEKPDKPLPPGHLACQVGLLMNDPDDESLLQKVEVMAKALTPIETEWHSSLLMADDQSLRNLMKQQKPFYQAPGFLGR